MSAQHRSRGELAAEDTAHDQNVLRCAREVHSVTQARLLECDDGNVTDSDGCSHLWKREFCGDGIKQTNEQCDDGNTIDTDSCTNACVSNVHSDPTACAECRDNNCRDFQGSGVDAVKGCLETVVPDFGANPSDPTFIQRCTDLVQCAFNNHCAYSDFGFGACYCGTASVDACVSTVGAANGPCKAEIEQATGATAPSDVTNRLSDLAFPTGWANLLLSCDRDSCNSTATGKCTP